MNLNWSNRVIKYVLFVFNFLFVISGIIMIAVGVSVKEYYTDYDIFLNGSYFSLPNLLIAIGSLIFFISFFGCCGAIRESWFMIFIFSILLSIIFIMEFSAGIAGYVLRDSTTSFLTDSLLDSMGTYSFNVNNTNPTTVLWDEIQEDFQCCGAKDASDWKAHSPKDESKRTAAGLISTELSSTVSTTTEPSTESPSRNDDTTKPTVLTSPPTQPPTTTTPSAISTKDGESTGFDLPASCCKTRPGASGQITCQFGSNATAIPYTTGCVEGFGKYLKGHAVTLGGVGIAIAFIQLFGVIFACHLSRQLKHGFHST